MFVIHVTVTENGDCWRNAFKNASPLSHCECFIQKYYSFLLQAGLALVATGHLPANLLSLRAFSQSPF